MPNDFVFIFSISHSVNITLIRFCQPYCLQIPREIPHDRTSVPNPPFHKREMISNKYPFHFRLHQAIHLLGISSPRAPVTPLALFRCFQTAICIANCIPCFQSLPHHKEGSPNLLRPFRPRIVLSGSWLCPRWISIHPSASGIAASMVQLLNSHRHHLHRLQQSCQFSDVVSVG